MAILPLQLARVSNSLRTGFAQGTIARTQAQLLRVQNELSTGKRLSVGSDDPGDAALVQQLQKTLEQRDAYRTNLGRAKSHLSEVDSALGDLASLLREAETIASSNVGSDVSAEQRAGAAAVVQTIYSQALSLANKNSEGVYLFGGDRSTQPPFVTAGGGVQFTGSDRVLENTFDANLNLPFMVDGAQVFGALSARVKGSADVTPAVTPDTRLDDLRGATGQGVRRGLIVLSNGSLTSTVDLSGTDTVGDMIDTINAAGVGGVTASVSPAGGGLRIAAGPADNLTVKDVSGGTTAAGLGILTPIAAGAGVNVEGVPVRPRVTLLTPLSALRNGAGINTGNGIVITNGQTSAAVGFSGDDTVEDMLNGIRNTGAGVWAEINEEGTGINILNPIQGTGMTTAENGGDTAAQLGLRSLTPTTLQSDLNEGRGVRTVAGADFRITRSDGTTFDVDLGSQGTIQDVVNVINNWAGGVGVFASLRTTGNGIQLTDTAGGPGTLTLTPLNFSSAAEDLGLTAPAAGNVILGTDRNPVTASGVFANLAKLRDALTLNDQSGITAAAERLAEDHGRAVLVRGTAGARLQEMEGRQDRMDDENLATKALLSDLADTDFTEAIGRFQTLQTALQATLQTSAQALNLSLLDFLG